MIQTQYFSIRPKDWEIGFFNIRWALLQCKVVINSTFVVSEKEKIKHQLEHILTEADKMFELLEFEAQTDMFLLIQILEDYGFRLVDSKIRFKTLFSKNSLETQNFQLSFSNLKIRKFVNNDKPGILLLTKKQYSDNPDFITRFKNRTFFGELVAEKYFNTWIKNSLQSKNVMCCVLVDDEDFVKGYFIYEKMSEENGVPVFKGILTAIEPEFKGKSTHLALQSFLFSQIQDSEYYIDNTTQLTNSAIIKNHIKSQRQLDTISLLLYRKKP